MAPRKKETMDTTKRKASDVDKEPALDVTGITPPEATSSRRGLRASTMNCRPGVEAGLAPRLQINIAAAAQKKRDDKAAKEKAKQQEKNLKVARETAGAKEVAALLDQHAQQEAKSVVQLDFLPASDEESTAPQCAAPTQPGKATASDRNHPNDRNKVHTHGAQLAFTLHDNDNDDNDNDLYLDSPLPQAHLYSVPGDDCVPMSVDDSQDLDSEAQVKEGSVGSDAVGQVKLSRPHASQDGAASKARSARESQGKRGAASSATLPNQAPLKPVKLTESQKKKARVSQVRGQLDDARRNPAPLVTPSPLKRPPEPLLGVKKTKKRKEEDAFTPDYRACLREAATSTPRQATHRPASVTQQLDDCGLEFLDASPALKSTPRPLSKPPQPGPASHPLWKYAPFAFENQEEDSGSPGMSTSIAIDQRDHAALSDEEIRGFGDDDVTVSRQAVVARKDAIPNQIVAILPNATIEGDVVVPASTKKTRAPRKPVSPTVSRAFFALDNWVQETVLTKIVPSLIDYYGAKENPWDLDGESRLEFKKKLNGLLAKLHPNRGPHEVKAGDKLWRFTRQQVYDWRSQFGKLTIKIVKTEVTARADQYGKPFAAMWVANALAKGGEATYSAPDIEDPTTARGALQTPYHIKLLTYHYEQADGSIIKMSYPVGALSLAVVAIRRAFRACLTGVYVPVKGEFSGEEVGQQTQLARKGAVAGLEATPHRFDALISVARNQVPSFLQARALQIQEADDDADAFAAVDPPSSPVLEHEIALYNEYKT